MTTLASWQKWGLAGSILHVALSLTVDGLNRVWYFYDLFWYQFLIIIDYPGALLHRGFLSMLKMPSMYDAPPPWYETLTIAISGHVLGCAWWFLLGALL